MLSIPPKCRFSCFPTHSALDFAVPSLHPCHRTAAPPPSSPAADAAAAPLYALQLRYGKNTQKWYISAPTARRTNAQAPGTAATAPHRPPAAPWDPCAAATVSKPRRSRRSIYLGLSSGYSHQPAPRTEPKINKIGKVPLGFSSKSPANHVSNA